MSNLNIEAARDRFIGLCIQSAQELSQLAAQVLAGQTADFDGNSDTLQRWRSLVADMGVTVTEEFDEDGYSEFHFSPPSIH
jgi:hypothetical protein